MAYYCHNCQDVKHQNKVTHCSEGILCRDCGSDFLEELNDQNFPSLVFDQPSATGSHQHPMQQYRQQQQQHHHHHNLRHHPYSGPIVSSGAAGSSSSSAEFFATHDDDVGDSQRGGGAVALASSAASSSSSAGIGGHAGSGGSSSIRFLRLSGGGHSGSGDLDQLIQSLFQQVFGIVGDLDDYALGAEGLDDVVTQLMNQLDGGGPPPATPEGLQRVRSVPVTPAQAANGLQCSVCFDEFPSGAATDLLPCMHQFHTECIRPWLDKHDTCPVCRKSLTGEDTSRLQAHHAAASSSNSGSTSASGSASGVGGGGLASVAVRRSLRRSAATNRERGGGGNGSSSGNTGTASNSGGGAGSAAGSGGSK